MFNFKKSKYELSIKRQGFYTLDKGSKSFSIEDYHQSGDYTGPMKFKKEDALKLQRFLNNYYKGSINTFHWKAYSRMKEQLNITTGVYAE